MQVPATKICGHCKVVKPKDQFNKNRCKKDGLCSTCKQCKSMQRRKEYIRRIKGNIKKWHARHYTSEEKQQILQRGKQICTACGEDKPLSDFRVYNHKERKFRKRQCRPCEKRANREAAKTEHGQQYLKKIRCKQYGLTTEDYDILVALQNGNCAVCGWPLPKKGQVIEHDHKTGWVRGIVHSHCNLAIGYAHEDLRVLQGAIKYLKHHQARLQSIETTKLPPQNETAAESQLKAGPNKHLTISVN